MLSALNAAAASIEGDGFEPRSLLFELSMAARTPAEKIATPTSLTQTAGDGVTLRPRGAERLRLQDDAHVAQYQSTRTLQHGAPRVAGVNCKAGI